ncbi:hypothetical protein BJX66DRAFT_155571 [Aspergillus keveii]|uniref:Cyanovirin-N domain-containing protein n=1 Tax=Aspergillus keveii TaxID=714993 RepID=A0ABR4FI15_9EURO
MLGHILLLTSFFVSLTTAELFSETCTDIHIPEANTILNATCTTMSQERKHTFTDLNDCLPCIESIRCDWDFCAYDAVTQIARCFSSENCAYRASGNYALDDFLTNRNGVLECDNPLPTIKPPDNASTDIQTPTPTRTSSTVPQYSARGSV